MDLTEDAVRGPRDTEIVDHPHSDRTERAMARTRVLGCSQVTTRELPAESSVAADARKAASGPTPSATARPPRASRSGKSLAQSADRRASAERSQRCRTLRKRSTGMGSSCRLAVCRAEHSAELGT